MKPLNLTLKQTLQVTYSTDENVYFMIQLFLLIKFFFEMLMVAQAVKNFLSFMDSKQSLPHSIKPQFDYFLHKVNPVY